MTGVCLTGALIFAAFVVLAVTKYVLRVRYGKEPPPQYHSYVVGIVFIAASFLLIGPATGVNPGETLGAIEAQTAAIQRLAGVLGFVLFIAAWWILTEKSRMQRYFDRLSRQGEQEVRGTDQ